MNPKQEQFDREYFDAAGNQRKHFPGEEGFVPGRDDEPAEDYLYSPPSGSQARTNMKIVQDWIDAKNHHNDLVDAADRMLTRPQHVWQSYSRKIDEFKPEFDKAKKALIDFITPIIKKAFPEFRLALDEKSEKDGNHTRIGNYINAAHGHVFLKLKSYKPNTWGEQGTIIIRDDGAIIPEFSKIFETGSDADKAYTQYRKSPEKTTNESIDMSMQHWKTLCE